MSPFQKISFRVVVVVALLLSGFGLFWHFQQSALGASIQPLSDASVVRPENLSGPAAANRPAPVSVMGSRKTRTS